MVLRQEEAGGREAGREPEEAAASIIGFLFFFFAVMGLEFGVLTLSHSTSPIFCDRIF
jgi:hypothetical protein